MWPRLCLRELKDVKKMSSTAMVSKKKIVVVSALSCVLSLAYLTKFSFADTHTLGGDQETL